MRYIARVVALLFGLLTITSIVGLVAAFRMKDRAIPRMDPDSDDVALVAILGPLAFRSRATAFRGGTLDCIYGGGVLDLREATLAPEGAHLQVRAFFGGGQILVPETWQVETRVMGLGGIGDARPKIERPMDAPRLTVEGIAILGGFGVASDIPEEATRWMSETEDKLAAETNGVDVAEAVEGSTPVSVG
jgi:hypothetical protein